MKINEMFKKAQRPERVIQFGEGVFLRGFVDVFLQNLNNKGLFDGSVVIVKPIPSKGVEMFDVLKEQDGMYTHIERGLKDGKPTVIKHKIDVISRLINPYEEYESFLNLAKNPDMKFIFSNTTEAGITYLKEELKENEVCDSYPAKITALLYERFKAGLDGFFIIPCELIDKAGDTLKSIILKHADNWNLGDEFKNFIETKNTFYNVLVDRIVTGFPHGEKLNLEYEDNAVDTSELFHLWALEGDRKILSYLPFDKSDLNVIISDDIDMYHTRKVRILNGAHTSLVPYALLNGMETVKECTENPKMREHLNQCINEEIIPAIADKYGMGEEELTKYADDVLERFENPFICHKLIAISLNSVSKFKVRVLPSILDYYEKFNKCPQNLIKAFAFLLKFYNTDMANDTEDAMKKMKTLTPAQILADTGLWDMDLTTVISVSDIEKYL